MIDYTTKLKDYALQIGFSAVGITDMSPFPAFEDELNSRDHHYDAWSFQSDPKKVYPQGKSIIVVAYDYAQSNFPEELKPYFGRAYLARCYKPLPESVAGARVALLEKYLQDNGCRTFRLANELPLRQLANRAGLITFGKNNFAYVNNVGSFVILYGIIDRELPCDTPAGDSKCPPNCTKCIDACPTHAIEAPFRLNPTKCVGYNNWMRKIEGDPNCDTTIPLELRPLLGAHIHGCDACQEACPRNRKKISYEPQFPTDAFLEQLKPQFNLSSLLEMTPEFYHRWSYPVAYNYITDVNIFRRNAAIAMGNTKDRKYIPDLSAAMKHPEATVRRHAAWALGQIGTKEATDALVDALKTESHPDVRDEIISAISKG